MFGTGNIRKQLFYYEETGEQANLHQGNEGTGTPWECLSSTPSYMLVHIFLQIYWWALKTLH